MKSYMTFSFDGIKEWTTIQIDPIVFNEILKKIKNEIGVTNQNRVAITSPNSIVINFHKN